MNFESLKLSQNFANMWNFSWPRSSQVSKVCVPKCILESYLVVVNDLLKIEIESKFCQNVKFFMTAVISEISVFDHFLNILKS